MIRCILPDGETETYVGDQFGNELSRVDFNGNTSAYTYYTTYGPPTGSGQAGAYAQQLEKVTYTPAAGSGVAAETVTYTYDIFGRQQTVNDTADPSAGSGQAGLTAYTNLRPLGPDFGDVLFPFVLVVQPNKLKDCPPVTIPHVYIRLSCQQKLGNINPAASRGKVRDWLNDGCVFSSKLCLKTSSRGHSAFRQSLVNRSPRYCGQGCSLRRSR